MMTEAMIQMLELLRLEPTCIKLQRQAIRSTESGPADHILRRLIGVIELLCDHEVDRGPDVQVLVQVLEVFELEAVLRHGELLV